MSLFVVEDNRYFQEQEIAETQNQVTAAIASSASRGSTFTNSWKTSSSHLSLKSMNSSSDAPASFLPHSQKRPSPVIDLPGSPSSTISSNSHSHFAPSNIKVKKGRQLRMWEPPSDPQAAAEMDVALADLAHSNLYGSNFAEDTKLQRVLDIARRLPQPTHRRGATRWGELF